MNEITDLLPKEKSLSGFYLNVKDNYFITLYVSMTF